MAGLGMHGFEQHRLMLEAWRALPPRREHGRRAALCTAALLLGALALWHALTMRAPTPDATLTRAEVLAFEARKSSRYGRYHVHFRAAAERHEVGWRWLAAIAYQESQWRPDAVSRTGVRGLMMLTRVTARDMGVTDRRDALQSIDGGARYLRWLLDRTRGARDEETRTALALASYHAGPGRVKSAWRESGAGHWSDFVAHLDRGGTPCAGGASRHCRLLRSAVSYVARVRAFRELL